MPVAVHSCLSLVLSDFLIIAMLVSVVSISLWLQFALLWCLLMLRTFSRAYWLLGFLLGEEGD